MIVVAILFALIITIDILWSSRRKHPADAYFRHKFLEQMQPDSYRIVCAAYNIRHDYPDLSGPELVRLVYWGASGASENDNG